MSRNNSCKWKTVNCDDAVSTILCSNPLYTNDPSTSLSLPTITLEKVPASEIYTTPRVHTEVHYYYTSDSGMDTAVLIGAVLGGKLLLCLCIAWIVSMWWNMKRKREKSFAIHADANESRLSEMIEMQNVDSIPNHQIVSQPSAMIIRVPPINIRARAISDNADNENMLPPQAVQTRLSAMLSSDMNCPGPHSG